MRIARRNSAHAFFALALYIASAWLLLSCQSTPKAGQSGSENLPDPGGGSAGNTVPCPCHQRYALRVTLLSQEHGNLSLRVEEVLHGDLPLVPGDVIDADREDDKLACFVGCAAIEVGDQAFAFYRPSLRPPPCAEREACITDCRAQQATLDDEESWRSPCVCRSDPPNHFATITGSPTCGLTGHRGAPDCDNDCAQETRAACPAPEQDYRRGHVGLSPWTDPIVFARNERGEISLARRELDRLWVLQDGDGKSCQEGVGDWTNIVPPPAGATY